MYTVDGSENLPAGKILKNILDKLNIWIHPIEMFVSVHQNIWMRISIILSIVARNGEKFQWSSTVEWIIYLL